MGVVSWMVGTVESTLATAAESQFAAVAEAMGGIVVVGTTLAAGAIFLNMSMQWKVIDGRQAFMFALKIMLVGAFALNWAEFNVVASALLDGLDRLGGALVASVGGPGGAGPSFFAAEFDELIEEFAGYLNAATSNMSWMTGAVMGAIGTFLLGAIGALCGLVLIFAKIMITFMIGIAPVMIACSLFDATKDYFHRWLSASVSYALYPLVIAGVFATVIGMAQAMLAELGDPDAAGNLGALVPFFMMMILAGGLICAVPLIVSSISGNFMMARAPSLTSAAGSTRRFASGLRNTEVAQWRRERGMQGPAEMAGAATRATALALGTAAAGRVNRSMERAQRLGGADNR